MTARVLVVDDILANVKLLEAKLTAEYFGVLTARDGREALEIVERAQPDIVLLDVMMPGMDGFEVCRRIKSSPATQHVPVIMVTALDSPADRVQGLDAGADDFLTKPVSDIALLARVRSLVRLKMVTDELLMRAATGQRIGLQNLPLVEASEVEHGCRILLIDDRASSRERVRAIIEPAHEVIEESNPQEALFRAAEGAFDLMVVSLSLRNFDSLRLCSQLRSVDRTRNLPILALAEPDDNARLIRALDLGVNDYIVRPIDKNELLARLRTQLKRKRFADRLKANLEQSIEFAVTDPLTGLHNRRYLEGHIGTMVERAANRGKPLAVLLLDIDHFKDVNDTFGHDVGDEVIKEFCERVLANIRGVDLACRFGGEEFVVVMPDADMSVAGVVAERLRERVAGDPFRVMRDDKQPLQMTVSVGVASLESPTDTPEEIMRRADDALYRAKRQGRNRVVANAA
jgi:two-component system cell cycle response regulator